MKVTQSPKTTGCQCQLFKGQNRAGRTQKTRAGAKKNSFKAVGKISEKSRRTLNMKLMNPTMQVSKQMHYGGT